MARMIVDPTAPYSYAQMLRDMLGLMAAYPGLVASSNAGYSTEGRQLPVLMLGTGRTKVFFCAAHHAGDYIASAYLMYTANIFARAAADQKKFGSYDIKKLLQACTVYIMPMVNPDGVALVQGGLKAMQYPEKIAAMTRVRPSYYEWEANANGVDLNRQYPAHWEKSRAEVSTPASAAYKGAEPVSEPEVKAVINLCKKNVFRSAVSFYTKGETIAYADEDTDAKLPGAQAFAGRLAGVSGYTVKPVSTDPAAYGARFEHWFREAFLYPGLLVTLAPAGNDAMPPREKDFFGLIWNKAKYICAETVRATLAQ